MVCSFAACHDSLVPRKADGLLTPRDGHSSEDEVVMVEASRLREVVTSVLEREGATSDDAAAQAELLVEGDLRGHHSHGVRRLSVLVGRLRNGLVRSGDEPVQRWRTESTLDVDGLSGFGPVVARSAIGAITERAQTTGVAVAMIRNSNHLGMLAPYVEQIAAAGQIGIALTTSEALVHPWGGARPMVGTNPIGIGVPTAGAPLVLDMSTAAVSMGKVLDHAAQARPIPLGWAVDESGTPTTDARAAARGAVSPFGGPKGYALALALETLVATLTGSELGSRVRGTLDVEDECTKGDVFVAVSLERLGLAHMLPAVSEYLDEVRASGNDPHTRLDVPGDRARRTRADRLRTGIPLHPDVWATVLALQEETSA
jgi:LDH2 family malate/lactate/ureidoglycolate dehydrogenase